MPFVKSHLNEMRMGWSATKLIMALRWRLIRSRQTKVIIGFSGIFVLFGLLSSINLGYGLSLSLSGRNNQNLSIQTLLNYVLHAVQDNFGSVFILSIFAMAVFAPFTGSTTISLFPSEDLQSIKPNETHRFFDSIIINCVSGIGLLQLITLTAMTSLLTIDVNRFAPMIVAWVLWFLLVCIMTAMGWTLEYIIRRFGKVKRRITGISITLAFLLAIYLSAYFGKSPFSIGNGYIKGVRSLGRNNWNATAYLVLALLVVAIIATMFVGSRVTKKAMLLSPPQTSMGSGHKPPRKTSNLDYIAWTMLFKTVWRTAECRKPLVAILFFGAPAMFFNSTTSNIKPILTFAIPLTVSLAWGVNSFGILGTGMNWMASQPRIIRRIPILAVSIQLALNFVMIAFLWSIAFFSGHSTSSIGLSLLQAGFFSAAGTSVYSAYLSVAHPVRTQLTSRGNALVPPLTALAYLMQLILITGIPALILNMNISESSRGLSLISLCLLYIVGFFAISYKWKEAETRARVIQIVSAP